MLSVFFAFDPLAAAAFSATASQFHRWNRMSAAPLTRITLQTCAYLRGIKEFADFSNSTKLVHLAEEGWIPLDAALKHAPASGKYRVGWRRDGTPMADWPVAVAVSNKGNRLFAMSWGEHTLSMVGNPAHPCIHADPFFEDLAPGQTARIAGRIVFFEGTIEDFKPEEHFA